MLHTRVEPQPIIPAALPCLPPAYERGLLARTGLVREWDRIRSREGAAANIEAFEIAAALIPRAHQPVRFKLQFHEVATELGPRRAAIVPHDDMPPQFCEAITTLVAPNAPPASIPHVADLHLPSEVSANLSARSLSAHERIRLEFKLHQLYQIWQIRTRALIEHKAGSTS